MARSRGAPRHARGPDITHRPDLTLRPRLPPQPAVARLIAYFMQPGAMGELRIQGFGAEVSVMVPSGFGVWASATLLHVAYCGGLFHAHGMQGFGLSIVTEVVGNRPPATAVAAILAALASPGRRRGRRVAGAAAWAARRVAPRLLVAAQRVLLEQLIERLLRELRQVDVGGVASDERLELLEGRLRPVAVDEEEASLGIRLRRAGSASARAAGR